MASKQLSINLNNGASMPMVGLGVLFRGQIMSDHFRPVDVVENAIDVGYRLLDTAQAYKTEVVVGEAVQNKIQTGLITRDDIFITTKIYPVMFTQEEVLPSLRQSLERLNMSHVDMFLLHAPAPAKPGLITLDNWADTPVNLSPVDHLATWNGMEDCVDLGLAKAIGVSNFNSRQIQNILDNCRIKPANVQIESHPFLPNGKLIDFCHDRGIYVTAHSPLGKPDHPRRKTEWPTIFNDQRVVSIAAKHRKTAAQIVLKYQIQRGVAVIPSSRHRDRMEENLMVGGFDLSADDILQVESCDQNMRLVDVFSSDHPQYPFHEEF